MKEYTIYVSSDRVLIDRLDKEGVAHLPVFDPSALCAMFAAHGFDVTAAAISHNYEAWRVDEKSGYRDELRGYHLFTPCGCNPLRFTVTTIDNSCGWQTTYTC